MTASISARLTQCLGVVSSGAPATISFNPHPAAALLVVAVGWASASSYAPPAVSFDGEVMTLVGTHASDTSIGAIALYTLPLAGRPDSASPLLIAPPGFLGNTQVDVRAFAGTAGALGVVITDEYGTSSGGVNTGTSQFAGIAAGSATVLAGMTWFGGTPSSIVVSGTGWSADGAATAAAESVFAAVNTTQAGALAVTLTEGGGAFWTMLVIGYEVLAGSPPGPGSGVVVQAAAVAALGVISSAVPASTTFNPTAAADFIVAAVGWASSDPFNPPTVSFGGTLMQPVAFPVEVDAGNGAIALYVLSLAAPIASPVTVTVNSAPNFLGLTTIALHAFSGSAHLLGAMFPVMFGAHDVGVLTGTLDMPGIASGSALVFVGSTFFGNTPSALFRSTGWAADGFATATNQSVAAFHNKSTSGGDLPITVSNATTFFNILGFGYEVFAAGHTPPASSVTVTASACIDFGAIGGNETSVDFDAAGASLLVVAASRTNNVGTGPAIFSYAGIPLAFLPAFSIRNTDNGTAMDVAFIANPPAGSHPLTGFGVTGYFGYTEALVVGLASLSGVVGVRKATAVNGNGANLALDPGTSGSLVIALVTTIFPRALETPNYGWEVLRSDLSGASINAWIFASIGGPNTNLLLSGVGFAGIAALALEFLPLDGRTPTRTATGTYTQPHGIPVGIAANLGILTPAGQDYHVYWESWEDAPKKAVELLQPDDFFLSRIPAYVTSVLMSFAKPQFTYVDMTSDTLAATGLQFPGSLSLLKATLDLLRTRNPTIEVFVALQQVSDTVNNQPYNPAGWGGLTSDHVASLRKFVEDFGLDGVIIDYEVISPDDAQHCTRHPDGTVTCYTDTELLSVIKLVRAGLPRPTKLILDALHVGAYGVGAYLNAPPNGFNSGYDVCVANDSVALAALDAIHIMSYDAGSEYDPRTVARAFQALFPSLPLYLGLRVGPLQYQDVKQTSAQLRDYCNTVIMLGMRGVHMYSGMWDVIYLQKINTQFDPPYGNYGLDFPDANIAGQIVAEVYHLGTETPPDGAGYAGRANQMRMNNRPPAANIGAIGLF